MPRDRMLAWHSSEARRWTHTLRAQSVELRLAKRLVVAVLGPTSHGTASYL